MPAHRRRFFLQRHENWRHSGGPTGRSVGQSRGQKKTPPGDVHFVEEEETGAEGRGGRSPLAPPLPLPRHALPFHALEMIAARKKREEEKKKKRCVRVVMDDGFICKPSSLASPLHLNERERGRAREREGARVGKRGRVTLVRPDKSCHTAHEIFTLCVHVRVCVRF